MVFEKHAPPERIAAEAAFLAQAPLPGVVEYVSHDGSSLRTVRVDGHPLSASPTPFDCGEIAGLGAAVASILADLHDRGLAHGSLNADHVIISDSGAPVLCSLGRPGSPDGDVGALGGLLLDLVNARVKPAPADACRDLRGLLTTPTWRWRRNGGPGVDGPNKQERALREVAERCRSDAPRPAARAVAVALRDRVLDCRLPGAPRLETTGRPTAVPVLRAARPAPRPGGSVRTLSRRATTVAAVALAPPLLFAAVASARSNARVRPTPAPATVPSPNPPAAARAPSPSTRAPTRVWPLPACPPVTAALHADVNGDGCDEPLSHRDGVLEGAGIRFAVGTRSDVVATGDWGCSGTSTLALLRPSTGEVFVFDAWAGVASPLPARRVAVHRGAQRLVQTAPGPDGCPGLAVGGADGGLSPVALRSVR